MLKENQAAFDLLFMSERFPSEQVESFRRYIEFVELGSSRMNLVSTRDVHQIVARHIADSVAIAMLDVFPAEGAVMDMGSGAGFPGIPVAVIRPKLRVSLVESIQKKARFLQEAVEALELSNVRVICERVENLSIPEDKNKYDVIIARAVARLPMLWNWSKPLLKSTGCLLAQKGGDVRPEIDELLKMHNPQVSIYDLNSRREDNKKIIRVMAA
jgi:16S rRNA (guanine527-N7)-methyltransferase